MRSKKSVRNLSRRGVALIITTLTLFVFGPMVGLAIDVGILYILKARLSQAADSACLAGARSLSRGADIASQRDNAIAVAQKYFDVNFPAGYWATSGKTRTVAVDETASKMRIVSINANVQAPLYFLRLLRQDTANIHVTAEARRRDVNVMMILDRSGSLETAGACPAVRNAASTFVDKFANGRDRLGMLSFNGGSNLDYAPNLYFKDAPSIYPKISAIRCGGWTGMSQALSLGYQQLQTLDERGALNVILFFTDGRPTALPATYPVDTKGDVRYGDGSGSFRNFNTQYGMPKSGCKDAAGRDWTSGILWNPLPKPGFIAAGSFDLTGTTSGLLRHDVNASSEPTIADSLGCAFRTNSTYVREDIPYLPEQDLYGNLTTGFYNDGRMYYPAGRNWAGKIRSDSPLALRYAAYNATDNAATTIRTNPDLNIIIYVIGLGGTGGAEPPDTELMTRIANAGDPPVQPSRPKGLYIYAPTTDQLTEAFLRIASEILRLAV